MVLAALGEREPRGPITAEEKTEARWQALDVGTRSLLVGVVASGGLWLIFRR